MVAGGVVGKSVQFSGSGAHALEVSRIPQGSSSLEEFLSAESSNGLLVGSDNIRMLPGGRHWDCRQPSLHLFGLIMTPILRVFVVRQHKQEAGVMEINVQVEESRTEILQQGHRLSSSSPPDDQQQQDSHWLSSLFSKSKIQGNSVILVKPTPHGWTLSLESQLEFKIKVPKYLPLPFGFSKIGSAIMKLQCQARARQSLEEIRDAYMAWASMSSRRILEPAFMANSTIAAL